MGRVIVLLAWAWLLSQLVACSSVAAVNGRALLLGADRTVQVGPDATHLLPPPRTEYRIGARDLLEVEVYELEEPSKSRQLKVRVSQEGAIVVPLIGALVVAGKTAREVQGDITERLAKDFIVNPSVSVMVAEHQARSVTVLGAVQSPGAFHLKENSTTLLDVLALAGGMSEKAGSTVYVVRGAPESGTPVVDATAVMAPAMAPVIAPSTATHLRAAVVAGSPRLLKIDLEALVGRGDLSANCVLEDGDVVHVPQSAQIFVMGQVKQGGAFPLKGEITLLKAIALAGGLKDEATPSATVLIRVTESGRETIPIDLTEVEAGSEKDLKMQPEDVIVVSETGGSRFLRGLGSFLTGVFHIGYAL